MRAFSIKLGLAPYYVLFAVRTLPKHACTLMCTHGDPILPLNLPSPPNPHVYPRGAHPPS
jgi:hypothetical protein